MEWINTDIDFDDKILRFVRSNVFFLKRPYHGNNNHFFQKIKEKTQIKKNCLFNGVKPI